MTVCGVLLPCYPRPKTSWCDRQPQPAVYALIEALIGACCFLASRKFGQDRMPATRDTSHALSHRQAIRLSATACDREVCGIIVRILVRHVLSKQQKLRWSCEHYYGTSLDPRTVSNPSSSRAPSKRSDVVRAIPRSLYRVQVSN